ncbi:hypothetical protein Dvina_29325 [Dactylosporangium vinaceum]|uniref:Uncharacterized protein n=1 Tax=Dactylosporangium vinaceum TaxID=53362 RepID=A0ABV5MEA4_9ACTN|nr:hypothetical protein [Dactylosporangium vinaceum]UAB92450.1 hypothetical protein Dvina_29325 [Dactylosporangium vinaceum]
MASVWRVWAGRGLAAVAAIGAAVALVGLTTGAWAAGTFTGDTRNGSADTGRRLVLDLFPDGRLTVRDGGDPGLRQLYDAGQNTALRDALQHSIPGMLDGFAVACVIAVGILALVGVFKRLPASLWAVGCAVAVGALTAVTVLRFEVLAALGTYLAQMHLTTTTSVQEAGLAGQTSIALVVSIVAGAAAASPLLRQAPDTPDD